MKKTFNYSFLKHDYLPSSIVNYVGIIERYRANSKLDQNNYPVAFKELEKISKINSVTSSNAIEGIYSTKERISLIVKRISTPLSHSEQEIAGYRDALDIVHEHYGEVPITEDAIKELHSILMAPSLTAGAGEYKTDDNIVAEEHADGTRTVVFNPPSAEDTPELMKQLLFAFREANQDSSINKLLLIPCFVLDYLCIHPFTDGNGRISRLLTLLLMYKNDYCIGKYISIEQKIQDSVDEYYASIKKCSDVWYQERPDYVPFIEYLLKVISESYIDLEKRFNSKGLSKLSKADRIRRTVLESMISVSKADICERNPDISPTTIEAELTKMVKEDIIKKIGKGRSTRYIKGGDSKGVV